jgi:hypothetical protein
MTEEQTKNAIENLVSEYLTEEEKFTGGNMSAGTRAKTSF